ncbi:MAG: phosphate ABC transporter ATP-binding protein [Bdellovibrionaceae bacterium]|nr:phosphate ABC transporter ATP-binding protein [Pseudobdellovibrionaceae bacterium]
MGAVTTPSIRADVKNLNFFYGPKQVLKNISMPIYENRMTALIGPSGCGKTTLLRCFNRMHDLYATTNYQGQIILHPNMQNILSSEIDPMEVRMRIGMVFQKPNPFPKSIFENVAYGLRVRGVKKKSFIEERVVKSLQQAGLWSEAKDRLHSHATDMSGGQQQRLCIARALATEPEILLLDEPTSALDPISTAHIEELITELKKDITILMVTHNLHQAARTADYTAYMYLGELIEFGLTDKIFTTPSDTRTENYITGRFG